MIVIVAGTRTFNNYTQLCFWCDKILSNISSPFIITGYSEKTKWFQGADELGRKYALDNRIPYQNYPADWGKYGKSAGPIRNEEMAYVASGIGQGGLIAFWDGKSRGTADMIEKAKMREFKIRIIHYPTNKII